MKSYATPLGSSHLWDSALKHAEELASISGEAAIIYFRPIDEHWFVLRANAEEPQGLTIKTTVYPDYLIPSHPNHPEHPLDGPALTDVHI